MTANAASTAASAANRTDHFVCPFCGLLCDDLPAPGRVEEIVAWGQRLQALCPRAGNGIVGLAKAATDRPPAAMIDGKPATLEEAVAEAARHFAAARRPVVGGLSGDVQAIRAALSLADRGSARVVHRNQFVAQRNLFAQQSRGAMTATLAEVKNRAELILVVGGSMTNGFPRLYERLFAPAPVFVNEAERTVLLLGAPAPERLPSGVRVEQVDCGNLDLLDSVAVLRAHLLGQSVASGDAANGLASLAQRLRDGRYGAVVWAAAELDCSGADLLVEQLFQMVVDLNKKTRWVCLPLGGNDADLTANAVSTWQTGFPLPIEFSGNGVAHSVAYDPFPDYADADLLLWLAPLAGVGKPTVPGVADDVSTIVIGAPSLVDAAPVDAKGIFIAVASPGVTGTGHLVRTDGVITMYAAAVLDSPLPAAAEVLERIAAALNGEQQ
jgi:formylmethanofuran dehydrogenase subunit B